MLAKPLVYIILVDLKVAPATAWKADFQVEAPKIQPNFAGEMGDPLVESHELELFTTFSHR